MHKALLLISVHLLPGRMRLRLSRSPRQKERFENAVRGHPDIHEVVYTPISQSLVVCYDVKGINAEEVIVRCALALSREHDLQPVHIRSGDPMAELNALSAAAGACLLLNHGLFWMAPGAALTSRFCTISGGITLASVAAHTLRDIRAIGQPHPEVLTSFYLVASFLRGNVLKAATITWLSTFARHLVAPPPARWVIRAQKTDPTCHLHHCAYEVRVARENTSTGLAGLLRYLPRIAIGAYSTGELDLEAFLPDSGREGDGAGAEVIKGLENLEHGIYLKVLV